QLEILLGRLPAFAVLPHLLHLRGGLLHQREDILRVLLGAESATRLTGMSGDQLLPVQREDLLDELLRFERIDVDEAGARETIRLVLAQKRKNSPLSATASLSSVGNYGAEIISVRAWRRGV